MSKSKNTGTPRTYEDAIRELHTEYLCGNWSRIHVSPCDEARMVEIWHNMETGDTCAVLWWFNRNQFQVFDMLERFKGGSNVPFIPPTDKQLEELTDDEEIELIKRLQRDRISPNI